MGNRENVIAFLNEYEMNPERIDFKEHCDRFVNEMERGLKGEPSSLKMIPTYITDSGATIKDESVIAIDAGGTNFRVSLLSFNKDGKACIEYFETYPMPGTKGKLNKEEFFNTMADYIEPVLKYSDKIGFCFSYPSEILPNKDGRLIHFSKGVDVDGVNGELIGANLLKTLKKRGLPHNQQIVLLNDTVSVLLGGRTVYPERTFDGNIGFILGTGTNTCYSEKNANITKLPDLCQQDGTTIINMESGGYANVPIGKIDEEFDKTTNNPNEQRLEKMISGAYQGGLFALVLQKACKVSLLSSAVDASKFENLTTKDINEFTVDPFGQNVLSDAIQDENDKQIAYVIIEQLIQRAAKLVAIKLAATVLKTGKGLNPCVPVRIAAEGTTFQKSKLFRVKLDYYVEKYLKREMGLCCEFVMSDNLTLLGTAVSAL